MSSEIKMFTAEETAAHDNLVHEILSSAGSAMKIKYVVHDIADEYVTENAASVIRKSDNGEYIVYHTARLTHPARRSFRVFETLDNAYSYALGVLEGQHGTSERIG